MKIKIIDDVISKEDQDKLEEIIILDSHVPFYYNLDTVDLRLEQEIAEGIPNLLHHPQWVHMLYNSNLEEPVDSPYFEPIKNLFWETIKNYYPERIKINLLSPPITQNRDVFHVPHFDALTDKYVSMIYYINDCDGDTYIFDQALEEWEDDLDPKENLLKYFPEKLTVHKRVSPKKGRMLIFSSNTFHASSPPFECDHRCVINMVLRKNR